MESCKEIDATETQPATKDEPAVVRLKKQYSLPMLSKDGRFVSILDNDTHTTKILEIKDAANGVCEQKVDLGMPTGKVDFSYDKVDSNGEHVNLITFHKLGNQSEQVGADHYTKYPSDDFVENVYVYDLNKGTLRRLTNNTRSNATYPAFRRDGKVVFIQHPTHPDENKPAPSKLVIVDPKDAREVSFDQFLPEDKNHPGQDKRLKALTALGSLWSQLCSPFGDKMDMPAAVMATLNLDARRCRSMVDKYWDSLKEQVAGAKPLENKRFDLSELAKLARKISRTSVRRKRRPIAAREMKAPTRPCARWPVPEPKPARCARLYPLSLTKKRPRHAEHPVRQSGKIKKPKAAIRE